MNLQAYASHRKAQGLRGTSHVAVLKAIEAGRLTEPAVRKDGGRWYIDPELADQQWASNTSNTPEARPQPKPAALPPPPAPPRPPLTKSGGPTMAEAQRAKAVCQAELARLDLMKARGELVLAEQVKQESARLGRQVRDLLLMIPSRNAAKVATMQDAEEIRGLLQAEIESALRGLVNA
jgi:hypothetical protein